MTGERTPGEECLWELWPLQHSLVPFSADAIENDAAHGDIFAVPGEAFHHGGGRCALSFHIDNQHHGPAKQGGSIGGAAGAIRRAIKQAHHALGNHERVPMDENLLVKRFRAHGPNVDIAAGETGGIRMKGRVNVIGTDFQRSDIRSPYFQGPQQS